MEIVSFLFGLGFLVLIAWAITILGSLVFGRKRRQPDQRHEQPSPQLTELEERNSPQRTPCTSNFTPANFQCEPGTDFGKYGKQMAVYSAICERIFD